MSSIKHKSNSTRRVSVGSIALGMAFGSVSACAVRSSRRMADGKEWTTYNLKVEIVGSY
jgi:hypothetical protein